MIMLVIDSGVDLLYVNEASIMFMKKYFLHGKEKNKMCNYFGKLAWYYGFAFLPVRCTDCQVNLMEPIFTNKQVIFNFSDGVSTDSKGLHKNL